MKELQAQHEVWVSKKYPDQRPKIPAVGCLEEAGELVHAVLKLEQVQLWGEDNRHRIAELRIKLVDAIGDCGIYACSLCNANGWDFDELWTRSGAYDESDTALDTAIRLVQTATIIALNPKWSDGLSNYISQLKTAGITLGIDTDTAVRKTWETVKCR